jgi:cellobiose-specific phosphotransferase system component IIA
MEVQEEQGKKRHAAAMDRIEKRHAREVEIEVQEAKVELEGALRSQTRQVRQSEAELEKVQKGHSKVPKPSSSS